MTSKSVYVYAKMSEQAPPVLAGLLNFFDDRVDFRYAKAWIASPAGFAFHPDFLPLGNSFFSSRNLDGALSVFRDAGPGVWGKEVINRLHPGADQADHLIFSNNLLRIGVFRYAESRDEEFGNREDNLFESVDEIYAAIKTIENGGKPTAHQARMLELGSSMDGMRPKSFVKIDGESWIMKFPSKHDLDNKAVSELIGMKLARACRILAPDVKLFHLADGRSALAVKRFDTDGSHIFPLMSAASAMGFAEGESFKRDYRVFAQTLIRLSADPRADCESLFRRMALNVMISNKDDHIFNQSVMMVNQKWRLSSVYDVVCGEGNRRNHAMTIGALGSEGSLANVLSDASVFGLSNLQARSIVDEMVETVLGWKNIVMDDVSELDAKKIDWSILHSDIFKGYSRTLQSFGRIAEDVAGKMVVNAAAETIEEPSPK